MSVLELQPMVMLVVVVAVLAVKGFAFVSSVRYPAAAYEATGKLTKQAWCAITGLGFAANLFWLNPMNLPNLVFIIAALVYLADVRPALVEVSSGR